MKLKDIHIGDRLRIRHWDDMEEEYGRDDDSIKCKFFFTQNMRRLCGREFTVSDILGDKIMSEERVEYERELGVWNISADMLEPIEDESWLETEADTEGLFGLLNWTE